ncbi:hypothetical protein M3629_05020 [Paenibacillus polysaccharolyticus]|uniref:hypothetical protein n=1 Tax=Paenibacillus polysaccharolyticus TaxID=582692 RepID=UPI00203A7A21|nr:hypothetical protein [Paenibacillus polysaccharolyticus]MCM3132134.1 hypothetical protein [Paenibacillus polysaccharolyticus]
MKPIPMIFSFIFIIVGISIVTLTKTMEEVIPKLGYAAFQAAGAGSYSPINYEMDLNLNYWVGSICILVGTVYFIRHIAFIQHSLTEMKNRDKEFEEQYK